jgi:hypothetical protein
MVRHTAVKGNIVKVFQPNLGWRHSKFSLFQDEPSKAQEKEGGELKTSFVREQRVHTVLYSEGPWYSKCLYCRYVMNQI